MIQALINIPLRGFPHLHRHGLFAMLQFGTQLPLTIQGLTTFTPDGVDALCVIAKATFIVRQGRLALSSEQPPIRLQDVCADDTGSSELLAASEAGLPRPGTDILVHGHAYAPDGRACTTMELALTGGGIDKHVTVIGDRSWKSGLFGARPSEPQPFESVPLSWTRAYGGADTLVTKDGQSRPEVDERNPIGIGFRHPKGSVAIDGLRLPNFLVAGEGVRSWKERPAVAGFGPIPGHWQPRRGWAGTYDAEWQRTRAPYLPKDFDPRFLHVAPADQVTPTPLHGGESFTLLGFTPDGRLEFTLPQFSLAVDYRFADGPDDKLPAHLGMVQIHPDLGQVSLVWHSLIACDKRLLRISRATVTGQLAA